jgi:hypothetical protein
VRHIPMGTHVVSESLRMDVISVVNGNECGCFR